MVTMPELVDFMLSAGPARVAASRKIGESTDFYKPVREAIVDMHEKDLDTTRLDDLLAGLTDPRQRRIFPKVVAGYKAFLRQHRVSWYEPPLRDWTLGPLTVRVAPELGLILDGRPYVIALHFRADPVEPQRVMLTTEILYRAFHAVWPGVRFAVLDVRRSRLHEHRESAEIGALLRAESGCLASLLSEVR